jgi:NAD+ diphosphatase
MKFTAKTKPPSNYKGKAFWFLFKEEKLLVGRRQDENIVFDIDDPKYCDIGYTRPQYMGTLDGKHCFTAQLADNYTPASDMRLMTLRNLYGMIDEHMFSLVRRAYLIVSWDQNHQYCGRCGSITKQSFKDRAKICSKCGLIHYPRISPILKASHGLFPIL